MTQFLEKTGKTEAQAIEKALAELKLDRDDVSVEVISRAKTGFLGFGAQPAKVKVSYEIPDPSPEKAKEKPQETAVKSDEKPQETLAKSDEKPQETAVKSDEKPQETAVKSDEKPQETLAKSETKPQEKADKPVQKAEKSKKKPYDKNSPLTPEEQEAVINGINDYLTGLMPLLHVEARPHTTFDGNHFLVDLEGENLGALIGRRGETLDSIQQLTGYSVNKICPKKIRIYLDAENYRKKREETLVKLAEKVAGEAVKHRRNVTLEAMNAYERHIIHSALENYPNVSTYSTGSDPNRRTVVAFRGKKQDR